VPCGERSRPVRAKEDGKSAAGVNLTNFTGLTAINNVSIHVRGRNLGIVGPNGAGKSVFGLIGGLLRHLGTNPLAGRQIPV
jgi:ABC-type branched-subunit amino acid transport system ATPase component